MISYKILLEAMILSVISLLTILVISLLPHKPHGRPMVTVGEPLISYLPPDPCQEIENEDGCVAILIEW